MISPWLDRLLHVGQAVLLAISLVAGLAWFARRTEDNQRAIRGQVDRVERDLSAHRRYIAERDRRWAEAMGWPAPPDSEGTAP